MFGGFVSILFTKLRRPKVDMDMWTKGGGIIDGIRSHKDRINNYKIVQLDVNNARSR